MRDVMNLALCVVALAVVVVLAVQVLGGLEHPKPLMIALGRWLWVGFTVMGTLHATLGQQRMAGICFAIATVEFWQHRNDDHWKRLKSRVTSVVRDLGHRLTTAPAQAPVPVRAES